MGLAKEFFKGAARTPLGAALLARRLAAEAEAIGSAPPGAPVVLVLNSNRWRQDLQALGRTGCFRLLALSHERIGQIHALFGTGDIPAATEFFLRDDPAAWKIHHRRVTHTRHLIRHLRKLLGARCVVTPAIHYRNDFAWIEACAAEGVPFVTAHKEFTVIDERQVTERVALWKNRRFRFLGSALCVTNANAGRIFVESGACPADKLFVTGLLRIDNIAGPNTLYRAPPDPNQPMVTLFSFGHLTGPFATQDIRSHYFSRLATEGFVDLFRHVHVAFAEAAMRNPSVQFRIKLKSHEPWWIKEINDVLLEDLGKTVDDIPNCAIVDQWAPELIQKSTAVIGLNSTVVLESRVLGRNTIIPVFAEATGRYADHVYFHKFLDQFAIARSKQDVIDKIEAALGGQRLHRDDPARLGELYHHYLGGADGHAADRLCAVIDGAITGHTPDPSFFAQGMAPHVEAQTR